MNPEVGCAVYLRCLYFFSFLLFLKFSEQVSFKNSPVRHTIPYSGVSSGDWQEIRKLDEEENWTERTQIVTKEDHKLYTEAARVRKM